MGEFIMYDFTEYVDENGKKKLVLGRKLDALGRPLTRKYEDCSGEYNLDKMGY